MGFVRLGYLPADVKPTVATALRLELVYRLSKTLTFYPCVSVCIRVHAWPKVKLRKLTERQRQQRFGHGWTRIHTDAERWLPHARPGEDWNKIISLCFGRTPRTSSSSDPRLNPRWTQRAYTAICTN